MSHDAHPATEEHAMLRRFERSEIVLHWANAVPFLILFLTGALNILSRFVVMAPSVLGAIRTVHKYAGVLWLVSIGISFFFIGRRLNFANLRDQFIMGLSDITWMVSAFRSAYNPHVVPPPAGKFNTGQKINTILVVVYVAAFSISGALMWFYKSMLFPWYFHASVFFMSIASLGGHLYLSLLHPSTRPGLIGIFTGMVPRSYVEHHHSLMIDCNATACTDKSAPGYRIFMTAEIIILVLVLGAGAFGVKALGEINRLNRIARGFHSIVNPGELSKAHSIKEINDCKKCHEFSGELPDSKCLACHKQIQARREARAGYHGAKQDKCIKCHKEHPFDRGDFAGTIITFDKTKFDHAVAAFKLEGKHKDVKCENCHKKKQSVDGNNPAGFYVGLRYEACQDCHKDPHTGAAGALRQEPATAPSSTQPPAENGAVLPAGAGGSQIAGFKEKCDTCHSTAGWKGKDLKFEHAKAQFKLQGKHANVACEKCHKPRTPGAALATAVFKNMKFGLCNDCHKDPHTGAFKEKCETCHSTAGWKGKDLKFEHGKAQFKLEGKHANVACEKCHKPRTTGAALATAVFKDMKFGLCSDCHKDPHLGELKAKCTACHSTAGWKGKDLKFDHGRDATYKLEGKHTSVPCEKCHKPRTQGAALATAVFKNVKSGLCNDCHKDPHNGELKAKCTACHSTAGWRGKDLKFEHARDAAYKLEGKHLQAKCVKCHKATTKEGLLDVATFKAKHELCNDCHKDPHSGELKAKCTACHSSAGWKGKDLKFDHTREATYKLEGKHLQVKCVKCHKPSPKDGGLDVASFRIEKYEVCAPCHKDPHRGELKPKCATCHSAAGWRDKDLKFDHTRDAVYKLEGKHLQVKCVKCHKATTKEGLLDVATFRIDKYEVCAPCHKNPHKGKFIVPCESCHNYASWKKKAAW